MTVRSLWLIGAGKMGQALYHGWHQATLPITSITLIDPSPQPSDIYLRKTDHWLSQPLQQADQPDVIVLAIKPQLMRETLPLYQSHLRPDTLVLSIAAGISLATLTALCGTADQPIIRLMPNTPAMVGQGITVAVANASVTDAQRQTATQLFEAVGTCVWLDNEDHMHAVTALSGSGPAYVFALIEAMTQAGVDQGLALDIATTLARQTVIGSSALAAAQADQSAAVLRQNVTSPGGTTAAGLAVLQATGQGLDDLMNRTIAAAAQRSRELGS